MEIMENAYAKLNISLDIVSRMDNGYHAMKMIMQSVSLHDIIKISCVEGVGCKAVSNMKFLPTDDRNIAVRAVKLFFQETGIAEAKTEIIMDKLIPVCAGLAGGSSDGAAVLRGLNTIYCAGIDTAGLEAMAGRLGSDVPFCVAGGTVLAQGRGDELTSLKPFGIWPVVICKPAFSISTPELFSKIRCEKIRHRPDTDGIIRALESGDFYGVTRRMYNVFEDVLPRNAGEIFKIKGQLLDNGAAGAVMSGTGSAVFGIFEDMSKAQEAYESLSKSYRECFLCETVDKFAGAV